jgi:toxin secretion/phage lysis holin
MDPSGLRETQLVARLVGAVAAAVWLTFEPAVQLLLILMVLDVASGTVAGVTARNLSSETAFAGLAKKALILILVAGAAALQPQSGVSFLASAVAGFYATHEALSVIENAAKAGVPIPRVLRDALTRVPWSGVERRRAERRETAPRVPERQFEELPKEPPT